MNLRIAVILLFCIICTYVIGGSASLSSKDLLGVSPEDEKYYNGLSSGGAIKCKDGSKKFTKSQLNDDFCDCPDGSDEPGTSACPNGKFYCKNAGHVPASVHSSRVNDGICDCCDGSDEYDGRIKCQNTCWEAGKVARDKLKKKIATYEEGVSIREREVEQAKLAIAKEEAELSKLKAEEKILKGLVQQLKEHKEQIEKAEEQESLQKEKEEKLKKEAEEALSKESKNEENSEIQESETTKDDIHDKIGLLEESPSLQDPESPAPELEHIDHSKKEGSHEGKVEKAKEDDIQQTSEIEEGHSVNGETGLDSGNEEKVVKEDVDSLSREELGRVIASRWTGKKTEQETDDVGSTNDHDHEHHDEIPEDSHDEEYNGYDSENDGSNYEDDNVDDQGEDHAEYHDDDSSSDSSSSYKSGSDEETDFSDRTDTTNPSWMEKIQQTVKGFFQSVNPFKTPVDKSEAARIKREYDESSSKLTKMQSRISSLTQKLKHDFGPEKEFYSFHGQCFESKENKYVYKVCPFKQATQVEGYSTTRLGNWEKFEDSYRIMVFSSGDKCWNGPDRSLKVKLRCGLKNEVTDVDEPSRCEYVALLSTPALCLEGKLKELRDKLEMMNKQQPELHDEL